MKSALTLLRRFFHIINEPKKVIAALILAFLLSALFDVVGFASLALLIQVLLSPESSQTSGILGKISEVFGLDTANQLIVVVGICSFAAFTGRTLVTYVIQLGVQRFNVRKRNQITERFYHCYLRAPLLFRLDRNFSHMMHHTMFLPAQTVFVFCDALVKFVGNICLVGIISIYLAKTNWIACLCVIFIFGAFGFLYYNFIKNRAARYAIQAAELGKQRGQMMKESFYSLNETRIIGCEGYFFGRLKDFNRRIFAFEWRTAALGMIPRPAAEQLLITFILGFTVIFFIVSGDVKEVSATLGIFGMAGLRMVPAASTIIASMQGMKASSFAVHQLYEELEKVEAIESEIDALRGDDAASDVPITFEDAIRVEALSFRYPSITENVIEQLSFQIPQGTSIALIGKSGSGKSTLVNLLLGQLAPSSGKITVDGRNIFSNLRGWQNLISYLPQSITVMDASVTHNVAFGVEDADIDHKRVDWSIREAQLEDLVAQLPNGKNTPLGDQGERISGGQRQRIGIARALYHDRRVLVMDEATSALDEETEKAVKGSIKRLKGKITVIMITHHLNKMDTFDHIFRMEKGRLQEVAIEESASH